MHFQHHHATLQKEIITSDNLGQTTLASGKKARRALQLRTGQGSTLILYKMGAQVSPYRLRPRKLNKAKLKLHKMGTCMNCDETLASPYFLHF